MATYTITGNQVAYYPSIYDTDNHTYYVKSKATVVINDYPDRIEGYVDTYYVVWKNYSGNFWCDGTYRLVIDGTPYTQAIDAWASKVNSEDVKTAMERKYFTKYKTHAAQTISISITYQNTFVPYLRDKPSTGSASYSVPVRTSYPVTFNANSGTDAPSNLTKWYNEALGLPSTIPKKTDYTFKGWATSEANAKAGEPNSSYAPGMTYAANMNQRLDLWAVWELDYKKPSITKLRANRCKANGDYDDDGGYAKVVFEYGIFDTDAARYYGGNTQPYLNNGVESCTVSIKTSPTDEDTVSATLTSTEGEAILGDGTYDPDTSYDVTVTMEDTQQLIQNPDNITVETTILPKATFPIDINRAATVIGFFTAATDDPGVEGAFFGKNVDAPSYSINGVSLIDFLYPVGSYYETSNTSFNPNNVWDGTWVEVTTGKWHRTV